MAGIIILFVGALLLVVGELAQSAGSWTLSFELPPPGRQGEYQGVFGLGRGIQQFLGPAVVTTCAITLGTLGWMMLAVLFVALGLVIGPLASAALKHRERTSEVLAPAPKVPDQRCGSLEAAGTASDRGEERAQGSPNGVQDPQRWPGSDTRHLCSGRGRRHQGSDES